MRARWRDFITSVTRVPGTQRSRCWWRNDQRNFNSNAVRKKKRKERKKRRPVYIFFFTPHPFIVFYLRPNSNERTNGRTKIIKFVIQGGTRSATPRSREKRVNASTVKRIHLHSFTVTRGNKTSPRPIRIPGGKETRIANRKKENLRERVRKRKGEESCGSF